ncbi:hypothetical protein BACI9J_130332 [Bacillus altitudinis]|nr:hypothetical protein BACI9J_130332 [Bacillus altitudinis]
MENRTVIYEKVLRVSFFFIKLHYKLIQKISMRIDCTEYKIKLERRRHYRGKYNTGFIGSWFKHLAKCRFWS